MPETSASAAAATSAKPADTDDAATAAEAAASAASAAALITTHTQLLDAYCSEMRSKIAAKAAQRLANTTALVRPPDSFFTRLDSSLKRNTAFVKKVKQFTATHLDALLKDMAALNLTKYISEISAALVEAKLKMTDVPAAIVLCSRLHAIYAEFAQSFFENWQKQLAMRPPQGSGSNNSDASGWAPPNASKLRVDLRLFAELIAVGLFTNRAGLPLLGQVLTGLIAQDRDDCSNLSVILSFCRHCGEEYAGLVPANILTAQRHLASLEGPAKRTVELPSSSLLAPDKQQNLRQLLRDYFGSLGRHLLAEYKQLQSDQRFSRKLLETKGELSQERRERLELQQANFDKLLASIQTMGELLDERPPALPRDEEAQRGGVVLDVVDDSAEARLDPWGDDETKAFYVDLPDLRLFLPNYAPKLVAVGAAGGAGGGAGGSASAEGGEKVEAEMTEETLDQEISPELLQVDETAVSEEQAATEAAEAAEDAEAATATNAPSSGVAQRANFEHFASNLTNCVNMELIDSAAIEFLLNLNTKNNRKKLTKKLFGVKRTRLDLLPFFSRLVATVALVSPEVAVDLVQKLKNEFRYHIAKKNQMNIESKIKVVRFIGEMIKFGMFSKIEGLFCLKVLLLDFHHHQIEMTCALLEVAGLYLFNCKESRLRTNVYLEQMMRLKTANALDSRYVAQIENAYFLVKPPEGAGSVAKQRTPMQQYIRFLIYDELGKTNVDRVVKQMRRLDWTDLEVRDYAVRCLSRAYNIRYHMIRCLADLVSGLAVYQEQAMMRVTDAVFEDIRIGLENHEPKLAQRRVAMAKYLGEMYNYRLVDAAAILNQLYAVVSLGVSWDVARPSEMDPPESLFRLKLACVLLETCGQYFTSAASRRRLDYYLVFLQQYYWWKRSHPMYAGAGGGGAAGAAQVLQQGENAANLFPILADYQYRETLIVVRPKIRFFKNLEQANKEVDKLRQQLYPNLYAPDETPNASDGQTLGTIAEHDDDGDEDAANADAIEAAGDSGDSGDSDSSDDEDDEDEDDDDDSDSDNDEDAVEAVDQMNPQVGGKSAAIDGEDNLDDLDEDDESASDSESSDDDDLASDLEASDLEGGGGSDDGGSSSADRSETPPQERLQEDIDFERAFEKMAADSYMERMRDTTAKPTAKDIPVPIKPRQAGAKKTYEQLQQLNEAAAAAAASAAVPDPAPAPAPATVQFSLMTRGQGKNAANKQHFRTFEAPTDSQLAINLRVQEQKIREEHEKVKRLTLNITERLEEEDYQISLLQAQKASAAHHHHHHERAPRVKHQRYKHPKGAPDADLIFS